MDISHTVLTLWYISKPGAEEVLKTEPKADRGFGRKFLAQLNPNFPVTPIGQFPLNRSAQTDPNEYYIGGYPGITVVQTVCEGDSVLLSQLPQDLLNAVPAQRVIALVSNADEDYAGFALWEGGELKRCLCASRDRLYEDTGLPEPFEAPFWAGEKDESLGGISLPFRPHSIMEAAQEHWLGITVGQEGPDLDVVGYAVDGRPEPKIDPPKPKQPVSEFAAQSANKLGLNDYDDYEDHDAEPDSTGDEILSTAKHLGSLIGNWVRQTFKSLKDRWRS